MKLQMISALILALILTQLPIVGKYFAILNTMIHESGHSLMALITGGEVRRVSLLPNTSGFAVTGHSSWIGQVLTSLAGYVFASFFAFVFYWLVSRGQYKWMVYILMGFLLINLVFWVRNVYGLVWILTFGAGFLWLLRSGHEQVVHYVLLFFASLILVESVTSAFEIMWISLVSPGQAGDAANLARLTKVIPAPLWGITFFVQALYFALLSIKRVFP
jgi:hypothetical protein